MFKIRLLISSFLLLTGINGSCQQPVERRPMQDSLVKIVGIADSTLKSNTAAFSKKAAKLVAVKDSVLQNLQAIPEKYFSSIDKKITKYSGRVSKKTEKTLVKLSKWETKIKKSLEKLSPQTAERLFANNQLTFAVLLQKLKDGEQFTQQYRKQYDGYRDKLTSSLKYLDQQKEQLDVKLVKPLAKARANMDSLSHTIDNAEVVQQFIKERKKQLIDGAFSYLGKSKYLLKINKETWYYAETMKNYKDLFNDEEKMERVVKGALNRIPGFQKFLQKNSMLSSLFGAPGDVASASVVEGLQTRAITQGMIQERIAAGGPGAQELFQQNMKAAQAKLTELKKKLTDHAAGTGGGTLPDFKPNMEKTKTFRQRLVFGSDIQLSKNNTLMPTTMDLALTVGYKLNEKSVAGIGASYKMGLGSLDRIKISNQGLNLRSFMDWKLKKQFFISGGFEMNYLSALPPATSLQQVPNGSNWQQAALAGISKKLKIKSKWFKETKLQLLYDFLAKQHAPVSQPVLFRVGYNF